jgi:hypothetical protein
LLIFSGSSVLSKYADFAADIRSAEYPDFSVQGGLRVEKTIGIGKVARLFYRS